MPGVGRIFNVHPYFHPNLAYFYRFNIECDAKQLVVGLPMDLLAGTLPLSYTGKLLSGSSAGAARVAGA